MSPLLLASVALAQIPSVTDWVETLGQPTKSIEETERVRTQGEPLLLYWMKVRTAPLGIGPELPGTLVANFSPGEKISMSRLSSFTFLGVSSQEQTESLLKAVENQGWVKSRKAVLRSGGRFSELQLEMPDGRRGTLAIRLESPKRGMADGRPSPSLWMHIETTEKVVP